MDGTPKKGHVCPYQPKVKRRPEDQMPEMKCVSTQVEMDEVSIFIIFSDMCVICSNFAI